MLDKWKETEGEIEDEMTGGRQQAGESEEEKQKHEKSDWNLNKMYTRMMMMTLKRVN